VRDQTKPVPAMNMAAAYSALTVTELKGMLGAALADHKRELEETRAKWLAEVSSLREAASKTTARLTSELQIQKNRSAALQRELDALYCELEKANTLIVDQGRKLAAYDKVTDLEKRLLAARRRSAS
jgi:septal ring factor EnvC (AmiA/AmiB activator)